MKITGSELDGFIRSVQWVHSVLIRANTVNSETFAIILFSRISLKDIFATFKNLRQGHDLPISVNSRVLLSFRESFIFTKLRLWENKTLKKISEFTVQYNAVPL